MCNLQIGDKVVVKFSGEFHCEHDVKWSGRSTPKDKKPHKIVRFALSDTNLVAPCDCMVAYLENGTSGHVSRFRKVVPDKHEPATDAEFLTLMGKAKAASRQLTKV